MFRSNYRSVEIVNGPPFWRTVGCIVLALFVQATFAPYLTIRNGFPSFVTIVVVLYAIRMGARRGAVAGIIAGVLTDCFSGTGGSWTIAYTLLALLCGAVVRRFFADGIVPPSLLIGAAVIVRDGIFWFVESLEGYPRGFGIVHLHAAVEAGIVTAVCGFIYLVIRSRFGDEQTRIERFA